MSRGPGGADLLALLLALVAILAVLAAGSYFLAGHLKGAMQSWGRPAATSLCLGCVYFALAWAYRRRRRWAPAATRLSLLFLLVVAWTDAGRQESLDLGAVTLFMLAGGAHLAALAWLSLSDGGRRLRGRSPDTLEA